MSREELVSHYKQKILAQINRIIKQHHLWEAQVKNPALSLLAGQKTAFQMPGLATNNRAQTKTGHAGRCLAR